MRRPPPNENGASWLTPTKPLNVLPSCRVEVNVTLAPQKPPRQVRMCLPEVIREPDVTFTLGWRGQRTKHTYAGQKAIIGQLALDRGQEGFVLDDVRALDAGAARNFHRHIHTFRRKGLVLMRCAERHPLKGSRVRYILRGEPTLHRRGVKFRKPNRWGK